MLTPAEAPRPASCWRHRSRPPPVSTPNTLRAWVALQEDSTAFEWLERAVALRENDVHFLAVEPRFDRIRADSRFRALLSRIGLQK